MSTYASVDENPNLCPSDLCEGEKKKKFVVPVVASVLVLFILGVIFWNCKRKKHGDVDGQNVGIEVRNRRQDPKQLIATQKGGRNNKTRVEVSTPDQRQHIVPHQVATTSDEGSNKQGLFKSKYQEFTYSEIESITKNFEKVIGGGGFGKVYLGTLKDDNQVAVKVCSPSSKQGRKEFEAEARLLMRVHHRNLVSLIGYCDEDKHMALVYEYMANGDLRHHLSVGTENVLNWKKRLQIAIDAGQGLEYLHHDCKPSIIHRDMKTSNILLDEGLQAKIADFGLSRDFKNEGDSHVSTDVAGTIGYFDPKCLESRQFNKKNDVYSFGVVLLELITGHSATIKSPAIIKSPQVIHITHWIRPIFEMGAIQNIVDKRLHGEFITESARKAVEIAMSCVQSTANHRPDMSRVVVKLKECLEIEMAREGGVPRMVTNETRPSNLDEVELEDATASSAPSAM